MSDELGATLLKPCPFCGCEHVEVARAKRGHVVACVACGARIDNATRAGAVYDWNTRAAPAEGATDEAVAWRDIETAPEIVRKHSAAFAPDLGGFRIRLMPDSDGCFYAVSYGYTHGSPAMHWMRLGPIPPAAAIRGETT